jgi:hypothetical protein
MDAQTWTLIISLVGAAAWIPHLLFMLKKWLTKPVLTIMPSSTCEVGFTQLGPVLNIRMAITADHQSILVDGIEFEVSHDSGATYLFRWHEIANQNSMEIGQKPLIQDQKPAAIEAIALKILPDDLKEVLLRCRLKEHMEAHDLWIRAFNKERRRLSNNNKYDPLDFYSTKMVQDMQAFMKSQMIWRSGAYEVRSLVHTRSAAVKDIPLLEFSLSNDDIALLQANHDNLPRYLRNLCVENTPQENQFQPFEWNWLYRKLKLQEPDSFSAVTMTMMMAVAVAGAGAVAVALELEARREEVAAAVAAVAVAMLMWSAKR